VSLPSHENLLRTRRFAPFFWAQALGALNDNLFKNALVILFAFGAADAVFSTDTLVNLAGGIFILPFFLFSATAGQLGEKYDKARIMRTLKVLEIGIMCVGALGLYLRSTTLLLSVLFLVGTQATLYGPVKYSILPQHLREEELVRGNALVETATFVAILVGTILGGVLIAVPTWGPGLVGACVIGLGVAGWLVSRGIPAAPPEAPGLRIGWNPFAETARMIGYVREKRSVFLSILGMSWFWFYGALFLAQFPGLGHEVLGGDEHVVTLLLAIFSIGIGAGCMLCERMSGDTIELGLVPLGSIGLTLFALDLHFAADAAAGGTGVTVGTFLSHWRYWRVAFDLALIGVFGGFFIVPLLAMVQHRSEPTHRTRIIAGNNILNAAFMVLAAILGIALRQAGLDIPDLFLFTAVVNALVAVYIYTLLPEFLMRFIIYMVVNVVYRVRHRGLENLPDEGAVVLVANHVSFVDALVLAATVRRPVRFVMDHTIFKIPVLNFVFRTGRAIPIAGRKEDPAMMERAFDQVASALEAGDVVCVFPEGRITTTGDMNGFRPGIERIVQRTPVPVVPMALRGLWGSFFSRKDGPAMRHPFRRFWSKIEVVAGMPVPPEAVTAAGLEAQVAALRGDWR
jgi:1-acyl-sn-glycerol-3-phosphate acyltransferase